MFIVSYSIDVLQQAIVSYEWICIQNVQNFVHPPGRRPLWAGGHEDHEDHEEIIKPLETHFSCPSCVSW